MFKWLVKMKWFKNVIDDAVMYYFDCNKPELDIPTKEKLMIQGVAACKQILIDAVASGEFRKKLIAHITDSMLDGIEEAVANKIYENDQIDFDDLIEALTEQFDPDIDADDIAEIAIMKLIAKSDPVSKLSGLLESIENYLSN
jgi:hypothetical protein